MNKYHSRYFQTIDEKGRIVLPGKLRRVAEAEIGTTGTTIQFSVQYRDGGRALFTEPAMRPMVEYYLGLSNLDGEKRDRKRRFFTAVEDAACDKHGRITIPQHLRERAGLTGNVVIVGVGDHIEVWNAEKFERVVENADAPSDEGRGGAGAGARSAP